LETQGILRTLVSLRIQGTLWTHGIHGTLEPLPIQGILET
jgi:hypothetical protein